jgi:phage gp36-like protein
MSSFIEKSDYPQSIHTEILDALTRDDDSVLHLVEERVTAFVGGYLEGRYDTQAIFAQRGEERNRVILAVCLDIIIYDIFSIHNPQKMSVLRKDRHDRAIEWLKAVQKGHTMVSRAPRAEAQKADSGFLLHSNPPRDYLL